MQGPLIGVAVLIFIGTLLLSLGLTRRYGWKAALSFPVLALLFHVILRWRERGSELEHAVGTLTEVMLFAAPALIGALVGILIGIRWKT
jgi:ABC-type nitrate/sulfonate/bicarbonate transport system permease component